MYVYLSKILPALVMPLTVALILALAALLLIRRGRTRAAAAALLTALAVLWLASSPFVAGALYRGLEANYPPLPLSEIPAGGCVLLLGGGVSPPVKPRIDTEFSESTDRVNKAAKLYRAQKAPRIIITGGNQPWSESPKPEAELIRSLLIEWGVPETAILLEGNSRNTRENALNSKPLLESIGCEAPLLVTSAAHMPRALAAFEAVGIAATPISTDVRVVDRDRLAVMDFVPDAGALAMTSEALREWIGRAYYSFKGWN